MNSLALRSSISAAENTASVRCHPICYGLTEEELFLEMLDNLASNNSKDTLDIFAARLATMACKAAVKGNHAMSQQEAEKLIDELLTLENPYHCPHGRPTIISMTRTELEKKFKTNRVRIIQE